MKNAKICLTLIVFNVRRSSHPEKNDFYLCLNVVFSYCPLIVVVVVVLVKLAHPFDSDSDSNENDFDEINEETRMQRFSYSINSIFFCFSKHELFTLLTQHTR